MEYAYLGRSNVKVSKICLGTMHFGRRTTPEESFAIMDRALEMGIQFFDTANTYSGGRTEEIIGRWLAQGGGRREKVVLATKVWSPFEEAPNRDFGLSAYKVKRQLEESLRRLQTDRVELYQMHYVDRATGWDEKLAAFEDLIRQGKVDYLGSSNHAGWDLAQAQGAARDRRFLGIVSEQHHYNLLFRAAEHEVIPCCRAHGIALLTYSPVGGGLLGGNADNPEEPARSNSDHVRGLLRNRQPQVAGFLNLCREVGHGPATVAVAWLLHQPGIACPIVGPRTLAQLKDFEQAAEIVLAPDVLERLDSIFPPAGQYLADIPSRVCRHA